MTAMGQTLRYDQTFRYGTKSFVFWAKHEQFSGFKHTPCLTHTFFHLLVTLVPQSKGTRFGCQKTFQNNGITSNGAAVFHGCVGYVQGYTLMGAVACLFGMFC